MGEVRYWYHTGMDSWLREHGLGPVKQTYRYRSGSTEQVSHELQGREGGRAKIIIIKMSEAARRQWSGKHTQSSAKERKDPVLTAAPTAAKTNRGRKRRTTIPRAGERRERGGG